MTRPLLQCWLPVLCLLLTACASSWSEAGHELIRSERVYALVGVNLIPIAEPGVRPDQTVIVRQGLIENMGPTAQVAIPDGAEVLDLRGKYLMPGLVDMHVHLADERDLLHFLSAGVTTVRNMSAHPWWSSLLGAVDALTLRKRIRAGELPGPDIFACGPILEGEPAQNGLTRVIRTPAEAEAAVDETAAAGYDCVKVYNHLSRPAFEAVIATAKRHQLPVMGHVPYEVGLAGALTSGMRTIEHLNAYVDNFASHYRFPEAELPEQARKTAAAGVYNCPTLVVWDHHPPYDADGIDKMALDPRHRYLSQSMQLFWRWSVPGLYELTYADKPAYPAHQLKISSPMVRMLHEQGAPLLIGTDANLTGVYPGSTALREMELFAEAGVPNAAILRAATLTAAEALGRQNQVGSLSIGLRADLLVLDANPLENIHHIHRQHGVMVQGRWLARESLEQLLRLAYP